MRRTLLLTLLALLLFYSSEAEGSDWLGEYVGGTIPGYEITRSIIAVHRVIGGPVGDVYKDNEGNELVKLCKSKYGGRALVNVRFIVSLGEVNWVESGKGMKVVSPGIYFGVYGDCVTGVRKK